MKKGKCHLIFVRTFPKSKISWDKRQRFQRFEQRFLFTTYTTLHTKMNIKNEKRWRVQGLQPQGVKLAILLPSYFTIS